MGGSLVEVPGACEEWPSSPGSNEPWLATPGPSANLYFIPAHGLTCQASLLARLRGIGGARFELTWEGDQLIRVEGPFEMAVAARGTIEEAKVGSVTVRLSVGGGRTA